MPSKLTVSKSLGVLAFFVGSSLAAGVNADKNDAMQVLSALHDDDVFTRELESDSADRIRLADRLTMLTQKVAASSCALTSEVAVDESYAHLEEAMHEIDIIFDALRYGNAALHILGPENNRRLLHDIEELEAEWLATLSGGEQTFRTTKEGCLSYIVGHNEAYPNDGGFGIRNWRKVAFVEAAHFIEGEVGMWMGWAHFTDKDGTVVTTDKTFGYKKDADGAMRIVLHHSSLPYSA